MPKQVDEIDKRILFHLASDARRTSAPDITENLDVSAATIRNRIKQLEERGVIRGYHANIDYEKTGGKLTYLFICHTDTPEREYLAREALDIPGVIQVREVMSGRRNLHVEAIGEDKQAISRIARDLSNLGLAIEDEALVQADHHHPYQPFGPESSLAPTTSNLTNLRELAGDSKVVDLTVSASADAVGLKISELSARGLLGDDYLIVAIERGEDVLMPNGETRIQEGDLVTVFSSQGDTEKLEQMFTAPEDHPSPSAKGAKTP